MFCFCFFFFLFLIFFPNVTSVAEWHSSKCWSSLQLSLGAAQVELEADADAALLVCPRSPALVSEAAVAFVGGEAAA